MECPAQCNCRDDRTEAPRTAEVNERMEVEKDLANNVAPIAAQVTALSAALEATASRCTESFKQASTETKTKPSLASAHNDTSTTSATGGRPAFTSRIVTNGAQPA